ncbi:MAG: hypothetical protein IJE77_11395 [Thermoguttaceae bacterium]|nr:hypothetical protein [Thermoguttaceae bacterium]MBQ9799979.1 hypothetical protein [Thermoguttaceae bacterium]
MKTQLETKNAVVARVPSGATVVLYGAVVEGDPTEAQIETGRNALAATLEIVGATNVSSYLLRHKKVELDADESLLLSVDSTYSKISPDPLPDAAEAEAFDETLSPEVASNEEVANDENGVETETTDAPPLDENAAASDAPETPEA